jgi:chemotaxis protein methyltransferase WspC
MKRTERILDQLQDQLGFAPELVGGRDALVAQIERFLEREGIAANIDPAGDPPLWNRLISEVIVPETSFFRYPESFTALREWLSRHSTDAIQILCLPCSSGEEAYSIAITARESAVADFHVDAGDPSARDIAVARVGHYSARALRNLPPDVRDRWFAGDTAEKSIRETIRFQVANLFSFDAAPRTYDVIFCRNLLIYFDSTNQRRAFERIDQWLKPGGILFLGPGEATIASSYGWKSTGQSMSFSFARTARAAVSISLPSRILNKRAKPSPALPRAKPVPRLQPPPKLDAGMLDRASALADAGALDDAAQTLKRFHEQHEPTASSLMLQGVLEEERGNRHAAEASYRKALYLDPDQLEVLLHLSLLLESEGRVQAAIPFRRRVERLTAAS